MKVVRTIEVNENLARAEGLDRWLADMVGHGITVQDLSWNEVFVYIAMSFDAVGDYTEYIRSHTTACDYAE